MATYWAIASTAKTFDEMKRSVEAPRFAEPVLNSPSFKFDSDDPRYRTPYDVCDEMNVLLGADSEGVAKSSVYNCRALFYYFYDTYGKQVSPDDIFEMA